MHAAQGQAAHAARWLSISLQLKEVELRRAPNSEAARKVQCGEGAQSGRGSREAGQRGSREAGGAEGLPEDLSHWAEQGSREAGAPHSKRLSSEEIMDRIVGRGNLSQDEHGPNCGQKAPKRVLERDQARKKRTTVLRAPALEDGAISVLLPLVFFLQQHVMVKQC